MNKKGYASGLILFAIAVILILALSGGLITKWLFNAINPFSMYTSTENTFSNTATQSGDPCVEWRLNIPPKYEITETTNAEGKEITITEKKLQKLKTAEVFTKIRGYPPAVTENVRQLKVTLDGIVITDFALEPITSHPNLEGNPGNFANNVLNSEQIAELINPKLSLMETDEFQGSVVVCVSSPGGIVEFGSTTSFTTTEGETQTRGIPVQVSPVVLEGEQTTTTTTTTSTTTTTLAGQPSQTGITIPTSQETEQEKTTGGITQILSPITSIEKASTKNLLLIGGGILFAIIIVALLKKKD